MELGLVTIHYSRSDPNRTIEQVEDLTNDVSAFSPTSGTWTADASGYTGTVAGADPAMALVDLGLPGLNTGIALEMEATFNTTGRAGFVYDYYGSNDYKFVTLDATANEVVIGHVSPKRGLVIDATANWTINSGQDYELAIALRNTSVSVTVDGQVVTGFVYNAVPVDADFGILTLDAAATFSQFSFRSDDSRVTE